MSKKILVDDLVSTQSKRSLSPIRGIKDGIDLIVSRGGSGEGAFREWCHCLALTLANGCTLPHTELWERREKEYLEIANRSKKNLDTYCQMSAFLVELFERDPFQDHLGNLYMELFGGNKQLGQCFTPMSVCKVCAQTTIGTPLPEPKTLADECSGGGAMLIAACWWYHENHVDYQRYLRITCGDVDSLCVHMSYIQLSLIGARAEVWRRNAITRETFDKFTTPMCFFWPMKYSGGNQDEYTGY